MQDLKRQTEVIYSTYHTSITVVTGATNGRIHYWNHSLVTVMKHQHPDEPDSHIHHTVMWELADQTVFLLMLEWNSTALFARLSGRHLD